MPAHILALSRWLAAVAPKRLAAKDSRSRTPRELGCLLVAPPAWAAAGGNRRGGRGGPPPHGNCSPLTGSLLTDIPLNAVGLLGGLPAQKARGPRSVHSLRQQGAGPGRAREALSDVGGCGKGGARRRGRTRPLPSSSFFPVWERETSGDSARRRQRSQRCHCQLQLRPALLRVRRCGGVPSASAATPAAARSQVADSEVGARGCGSRRAVGRITRRSR